MEPGQTQTTDEGGGEGKMNRFVLAFYRGTFTFAGVVMIVASVNVVNPFLMALGALMSIGSFTLVYLSFKEVEK